MKKCISMVLVMVMLLMAISVGSLSASAISFIVKNADGEEVLEGPNTYESDGEGNLVVYADDLYFYDDYEKPFIITDAVESITLVGNEIDSIVADHIDGMLYIRMENAIIDNDVSVTQEEEAYLIIDISGENIIGGTITTDGYFTLYGDEDATLLTTGIVTNYPIYLEGISFENMKEEYVYGETTSATQIDPSEPVIFTIKKEAIFPDDDEYAVNDGKPFVCGEELNIVYPIVKDSAGNIIDPQPKMKIVFYRDLSEGDNYDIELVDENDWYKKPTEPGNYIAYFHVDEKDPIYEGEYFYTFSIEHDLELVKGKAPTETEAGYKDYYACKVCDDAFFDAEGNEIKDLSKWKAKGGEGYLPPLGTNADPKNDDPEKPVSPDTGSNGWMAFATLATLLVATVCVRKKVEE